MLGGADAALGEVAVELGELRAMQREIGVAPAARTGAAAEREGERRQRDAGEQQEGKPDHAERGAAS